MYEVRLHVGGLTNPEVGAPDVARFLLSLGVFKVRGVDLVADPHTGEPRGFAFCDVACTDEVQLYRAIRKYTGTKWRSCKLRFGVAKPDYRQRLQREWDEEAAARLEAEEAARLEEEARRIELKIAADALGDANSLTLSTSGAHCRKRTRVVVPFGAPRTVVGRGGGATFAVSARPANEAGKTKTGKKLKRPVRTVFDGSVHNSDVEHGARVEDENSADDSDSCTDGSSDGSGSTDDESEKKEERPALMSDQGENTMEDTGTSDESDEEEDDDDDDDDDDEEEQEQEEQEQEQGQEEQGQEEEADAEEASGSDEDAALRSVLFGDLDDAEGSTAAAATTTAAAAAAAAAAATIDQREEAEDSSEAESDSSSIMSEEAESDSSSIMSEEEEEEEEETGNASSPQKRGPESEAASSPDAKKARRAARFAAEARAAFKPDGNLSPSTRNPRKMAWGGDKVTHNAPEAISKFLERKARLAVEEPDKAHDASLDPELLDLALNHTKRTQLQTKLDADALVVEDEKDTALSQHQPPSSDESDDEAATSSPVPEKVSSLAAWRLLGFGR